MPQQDLQPERQSWCLFDLYACDDEDAKFVWGYEGIYMKVTARFIVEGDTDFSKFKFVETFGPFLTGDE